MEQYKNDDYVRKELIEARRLMGQKSTDFDLLIKGSGYIAFFVTDEYL